MALPLLAVVLVVLALVFALGTRRADPLLTMWFALIMAVAGGAVLIGSQSDFRYLGGAMLLVAVTSAAVTLFAPAADRDHTPR